VDIVEAVWTPLGIVSGGADTVARNGVERITGLRDGLLARRSGGGKLR